MRPRSSRVLFTSVLFAVWAGAEEPSERSAAKPSDPDTRSSPQPPAAVTPTAATLVLQARSAEKPAGPRPGSQLPLTNGMSSTIIGAEIRAGLPAFTPPKTPPPGSGPVPDTNDVVFLPRYEVNDTRSRLPSDADVLTKAAREELLRKQFPGASFKGQDPDSVSNYAALMSRDEKRLRDMKDLTSFADTLDAVGRGAESKELRKEIQRTFLRRPTWREEAMDKLYNQGNR